MCLLRFKRQNYSKKRRFTRKTINSLAICGKNVIFAGNTPYPAGRRL